jgi:hypothetical protein
MIRINPAPQLTYGCLEWDLSRKVAAAITVKVVVIPGTVVMRGMVVTPGLVAIDQISGPLWATPNNRLERSRGHVFVGPWRKWMTRMNCFRFARAHSRVAQPHRNVS